MPSKHKVAFIGHPLDMDQYRAYIRYLRPDKTWRDELLLKLFEWAPSYRVREYADITLDGRRFVDAALYMVPFLPEMRDIKLKKVIEKVDQALRLAADQGCTVAALGAFTSIVLQGREEELQAKYGLRITSGNTMTAAIIVRSIEQLCNQHNIDLTETTLGIIGASGDIGSGCVAWFGDKVGRMVLSARSLDPLKGVIEKHRDSICCEVTVTTDNRQVVDQACIVIVVTSASTHLFTPGDFRPGTIVCDASAPLNVKVNGEAHPDVYVYHGGIVRLPVKLCPEFDIGLSDPYDFYGCQVEGILLAMDNALPSSWGRGNITREKLETYLAEMYNLPEVTVSFAADRQAVTSL